MTLNNVLDVTKKLEELLSEKVTIKNREQIISQITHLVEKRGQLLNEINPPFSSGEQLIGKEVVALNNKIQKQMNSIFIELKLEMKQINKQKKSTKTYENPYKSVQTMDGMFLDQKK